MRVYGEPRAAERFVGLMSGTSADGIDAIVTELSGRGRGLHAKLQAHVHVRFPAMFRQQLLHACLHGTVAEVCQLNFSLGERLAQAALAAIHAARLKPSQIAAIGSHGQTMHHLPQARHPSTLQLGEPCVIAERTGITTVADFRVRDVAAGGEGAPLVPCADWALFTHNARPRIVQNLGGIANLTFLPRRAALGDVLAFDTGPGNMVMDAVVAKLTNGKLTFDREGKFAAQGQVSESLLADCMRHPFIRRRPPKTTGREEFGESFVKWFLGRSRTRRLADGDIVATATAFTAESIAQAYRRFVFPHLASTQLTGLQVILGGGGVKNQTLRRMLAERLGKVEILTHEYFGIPDSAKEALAFAILAHATLHGRPSNVIGATGARRPVILGKIVPA